MFGCVLVFLIQWLFLGDLRSAVIVATNIPFALFFSIILLVITGESANLLSVGAVDFGIIVDSAVILVENVFRNFQKPQAERHAADPRTTARASRSWTLESSSGWTNRLRMIFISAMQVDRAVLFSTLITVAAFIPLFTMQGVEGQIFGPMARTYGYALAGALIATFTVTPALCLAAAAAACEGDRDLAGAPAAQRSTRRCCAGRSRIAAPRSACGAAFLLLVAASAADALGSEFLPALEEGNLWIRATLPPTISLEAGDAAVTRMREILKSHPEVITVTSQHGRPDDGSDASGFNNVEFFCPLKPFDQWPPGSNKDRLIAELQKQFSSEFVGTSFNFSQYIQDNVEEGLSGIKGANSVKIFGPDLRGARAVGRPDLRTDAAGARVSRTSASSACSGSPISTSRSIAPRRRATD